MNRVTALSHLLGRPLLVEKRALEVMISIASRGEFFEGARQNALEAREGAKLKNARAATVRGRTAVIPVTGPLVRHADMFDEISGATSYSALRKDLQVALDDPNIDAIAFEINSPGGEVTGCQELADAIYASSKKTIAYVDGMACSAAYWIASACDELVIAPTGEAGSIGVMLGWLDDTGALEQAGVKEIRFTSSQSPNKNPDPESDAGRAQYQRLVDDLAAVFVAGVARNRGVSDAHVLEHFGQGGVFVGEHAVKAGLADRIGNFEAVLADLANRQQEKTMTYAKMLGLGDDATAEQVGERIQALAKFHDETLAQVGAKNADEARGTITAALADAKDAATIRDRLAELEATSRAAALRGCIEKGFAEKRLSLGRIATDLPLLISDEASGDQPSRRAQVQKALDALADKPAEKASDVIAAVCSVPVTASELRTIEAYVAKRTPVAAEPKKAPKRDSGEDVKAIGELGDEGVEKVKRGAANARAAMDRNKAAQSTTTTK
jgi:ClpP class serine protease